MVHRKPHFYKDSNIKLLFTLCTSKMVDQHWGTVCTFRKLFVFLSQVKCFGPFVGAAPEFSQINLHFSSALRLPSQIATTPEVWKWIISDRSTKLDNFDFSCLKIFLPCTKKMPRQQVHKKLYQIVRCVSVTGNRFWCLFSSSKHFSADFGKRQIYTCPVRMIPYHKGISLNIISFQTMIE